MDLEWTFAMFAGRLLALEPLVVSIVSLLAMEPSTEDM
jgi:hypothetical protein